MKTLRPYQQDALDAIMNAHHEGKKQALVVMATGLGKMVLAARLTRDWLQMRQHGRVLFLVHMTDILRDARDREFIQELEEESIQMGILSNAETNHLDASILFASFQSMRNIYRKFKKTEFDLVLVDEAHHSQAETYREVIEYFTPEMCIGFTATPDRMDGLQIQEIFGEAVYTYSLEEALADGKWLAQIDYRLMIDDVSKITLQELLRRAEADADRALSVKDIDNSVFLTERTEQIIRKIQEVQGDDKQTVIFCRSIEHLETINALMPTARAYHSGLSKILLEERLCDFRAGGFQTAIVVDKFNEAVDLPDAELLVFLRPTDSETVWRQHIGRGVRKTDTKTSVIILDFVGNCTRIWQIAKLRDSIQCIAKEKSSSTTIEKIGIEFNFSAEVVDLLRVLDRVPVPFYETIKEAMAAVQQLKHVPKSIAEYKYFRLEDKRLPARPDSVYTSDWNRVMKWNGFLGIGLYPTVEEAMLAVKRLVPIPKTVDEYKRLYKQDPKLLCQPEGVYPSDWDRIGKWKGFLDTAFYKTVELAMEAVARLKPLPTTMVEYKVVCEQDPKLPMSPDVFFKWDWKKTGGWQGFLKSKPYTTLEEAMLAVQKLIPVPTRQAEYNSVFKQDYRLYRCPDMYYLKEDWARIGKWKGYLNTKPYSRIEQAMEAVQLLNPHPASQIQYFEVYVQNSRLVKYPQIFYGTDEWKRVGGIVGFLGKLKKDSFQP